jgi:beta-glucosidase
MQALKTTGKPIVFVMCTGSALGIEWEAANIPAILNAWYPGQDAGTAVADVLFGDYNPAGRLPVTFYRNDSDLPPFADYSMSNRTYRYFKGKPLYPFGYGLSYTTFSYQWDQKPRRAYRAGDTIACSVQVSNNGKRDGDEVVQAYIRYPRTGRLPAKELRQFRRINIPRNNSATIDLKIPLSELKKWDAHLNDRTLYPGDYQLILGGNSRDEKLAASFTIK